MKKAFFIVAVASLWIGPASGALRFGLGNAVAKRGADLTNKAGTVVGPDGRPRLPSCGSNMALFTNAPITDPSLIAVNPIGHVFPPGHTFPADHGYFFFNASTTTELAINLYAPSDGWVVQTTSLIYGNSGPQPGVNTEYFVAFSPCAEVTLNILGIVNLIPALTNPAGASSTSCSPFNSGVPGVTESCVTTMEVPVKAGQIIGSGVSNVIGLDFGPMEDTRAPITGFANPARHELTRGLCPLNYFVPSVQAAYTAMLGTNNGSTFIPRTTAPLCGTIMQDIPGTAQGDWYLPGQPNIPDNPHLALIHDNMFPSTGTFSVGTSVPGFGGAYDIFPKTVADGSRIDYDFGLVNDTQIYCYDSFLEALVNGAGVPDPGLAGHIVLIQLSGPSLTNLTLELQNPGTSCAATAGSWGFTPAAVTFQR